MPFWPPILAPFLGPNRQRAVPNFFFSAPEASKNAPRASLEAFRGSPRRRCDLEPILTPFWARFWRPWTYKKYGFRVRGIAFFVISPLSIRNRFWTPFWTFPGSFGGAFWPPRWLQPVLRFLLERPRAAQRIFFSAPRGEKEGSKKGAKKGTLPRALRTV